MRALPLHSATSISTSTLSLTAGRAAPLRLRPTDRATYVFSTRTDGLTIYLAAWLAGWLPNWLACAALAMLLLCHQIGAPPAPCRGPPSLLRPTNREGEKKKGEKELVDQPGDGGALARLLIGGGGLARVAQVMSTCLNSSSTEKRGGRRRRQRRWRRRRRRQRIPTTISIGHRLRRN